MDEIKGFVDAVKEAQDVFGYFETAMAISWDSEAQFEHSLESLINAHISGLAVITKVMNAWRKMPRAAQRAVIEDLRTGDGHGVN